MNDLPLIQARWLRRPALAAGALAVVAATVSGSAAQTADDVFFDSSFDGGWVGTIKAGASHIPFQFNANVGTADGVGYVIMANDAADGLAAFAADFRSVSESRLEFQIDDSAPLRPGRNPAPGRFGTATLKLSHEASDDTVSGRSTGSLSGKASAVRMAPDLPLQRLWQASARLSGTSTFFQLAATEADDGTLGGFIVIGGAAAEIDGERQGTRVQFTTRVDGEDFEFSGKLKKRNNLLKGRLQSSGSNLKLTFVTADGNGKPMKFKDVQRLAPVTVLPGEQATVRIVGKNLALGAIAHLDSPDSTVDSVEFVSGRQLIVSLTPGTGLEIGTSIAVRVVNGDGETASRSAALIIGGDDPGPAVSFSADLQPIFTTNCALAGCHIGSGPAGLNLEAGNAYGELVNVPSTQQSQFMRVMPDDPDNSYLIRKIEGGPGISGGRMPLGRTALTQAQIDLFRSWIAAGAEDN